MVALHCLGRTIQRKVLSVPYCAQKPISITNKSPWLTRYRAHHGTRARQANRTEGARRTYTSSGRGSLNILTRAVHRPLSIKTRGGPGYAWVLNKSYCASNRHQPLVTPRMVSGGPCRGGSIPLWSMALARLASPSVYHGCGGHPGMALRVAATTPWRAWPNKLSWQSLWGE